MIVLDREQVRSLDRIAVERFGIPGLVLMENAGAGATEVLLRHLGPLDREAPILVLCGPGNNGGDGFVVARHLRLRGYSPRVVLLGEAERFRGPGEAGTNFHIVERLGLPVLADPDGTRFRTELGSAALVVDAILGTGLSGEVRGAARSAIDLVNPASVPVFAVDTPSGLDCDTGRPLGTAMRADATATFAAMKRGFLAPEAAEWTGSVEVVGIGAPLVWE